MKKEEITNSAYYKWQKTPLTEMPKYFRQNFPPGGVFNEVKEIEGVKYAIQGDYMQALDWHFQALTEEEYLKELGQRETKTGWPSHIKEN